MEVTPGASRVTWHDSDHDGRDLSQSHIGVQVATGVTDRVHARVRYERIKMSEDDGFGSSDAVSVHVLALGPKIGLIPDELAFALPVGFAWGEDIRTRRTFQAHPTVIGTFAAAPPIEVNVSAKALLPLRDRDDVDDLVALNLGLGVGPDPDRRVIRPEFGVLLNPGEDGRFQHFSVGVTFYTGR